VSLLFDQNLSKKLPSRLVAEYPGSEHVITAGLDGASDRFLWNYAASKGMTIVSKDSDFQHLANQFGPPPKVIFLCVGNGGTIMIEALLRSRFSDVISFLADPASAILELP